MRYYLLVLLLCAVHVSSAQISATTNFLKTFPDTINLSGIILDSNGKPAKNVFISRPFYECYPNYKISTITDSLGKFHLNGVRFKDTLQVQAMNYSRQIINNGSRTLHIFLPPVGKTVVHKPVKIQAAEVSKKKPTHNLKNIEDCGEDYHYYMPETEAEFPGGHENLQKFIADKLNYPEQSLRNNIEGEVVIQFQVSSNGTPNSFTITSGLNKECNEAALKVLSKMPKWKPATLFRPINSTQSLAVEFSIKR